MNTPQLIAKVRELTGISIPELLSDAAILDYLNEEFRSLQAEADWPAMRVVGQVSVVADDGTFGLPGEAPAATQEGFGTVVGKYLSFAVQDAETEEEFYPVRWVGRTEFLQRFNPDDTGRPEIVSQGAGGLWELSPIPDKEYNIRFEYVAAPSSLTNSSGSSPTSVVPAAYVPALYYAAAARVLIADGDDTVRIGAYLEQAARFRRLMFRNLVARHAKDTVVIGGRTRRRFRGRRL